MALPNETRVIEWRRDDGFVLSTDRARLDIDRVQRFLGDESYWAQGISRELVLRSIEGAISVGLYDGGQQVGFARVLTDGARLAYLMDVFIDRNYRGRGLGSWLATAIRTHPDLITVSRWLLSTKDAHAVYARAGWSAVRHPDWLMEVFQDAPSTEASPTQPQLSERRS
ncbi:GNAT superfamily N-acetyltransferase [Bradyrhizobium sp. LB14.3]|uniref:GNAT family N-acetyltransferase n=1 Tax=Bradyrhizobium sp. LB14.3 TaxID=3156328 RepID=UPI003394C151